MDFAVVDVEEEAAGGREHAVRLQQARAQKAEEVVELVGIARGLCRTGLSGGEAAELILHQLRAVPVPAEADAVARRVAHRLHAQARLPLPGIERRIDVDQRHRTSRHPSQRLQIVALHDAVQIVSLSLPLQSIPNGALQTETMALTPGSRPLDSSAARSIVFTGPYYGEPGCEMADAATLNCSKPQVPRRRRTPHSLRRAPCSPCSPIAAACATPTRTPAPHCLSMESSWSATAWAARPEVRSPAIWQRRHFWTASRSPTAHASTRSGPLRPFAPPTRPSTGTRANCPACTAWAQRWSRCLGRMRRSGQKMCQQAPGYGLRMWATAAAISSAPANCTSSPRTIRWWRSRCAPEC